MSLRSLPTEEQRAADVALLLLGLDVLHLYIESGDAWTGMDG